MSAEMTKYEFTIGKQVDLRQEQQRTFSTPRLKSNILLKSMYLMFDLLYGRKPALPKVKVLEMLARYPYWAWENAAYHRMTRIYARRRKVRQDELEPVIRLITLGRSSQDNEQLHLLLVEDIIHQKGIKLGWFRHYLIPRLMALGYYYLTRLIFRIRPAWSFLMNAAFESHAEHEYMSLAQMHPGWDSEKVVSEHFKDYPRQETLADLMRRIALDERDHMYHSLEEVESAQR